VTEGESDTAHQLLQPAAAPLPAPLHSHATAAARAASTAVHDAAQLPAAAACVL
jgi:hypothetical protein